MTIDKYFPTLDPPDSGLAMLQVRLDQREGRLRPFAITAVIVSMLALSWAVDVVHSGFRASAQVGELRRMLAEHRSPPASVNGQLATPFRLESDRVEVYFVEATR